jgi:4-hydroxy-tetrahydrodipicolinate synthase
MARDVLKWEGAFTALATPFTAKGEIDWAAYDRLLERQLRGGVSGVVPCGTTGESPTLTKDEKLKLIEAAVKACKGKALVLAGTGSNNTAQSIEFSKAAADRGVDGLLVVVPYYNKPSQAGLEAHFTAIADSTDKPLILYNVPGRTITSLSAATVGKLAAHPRINGIKEATGNLAVLTEMREQVAKHAPGRAFAWLSGDDPTLLPFMAAGGNGVISVASNILPAAMARLCKGGPGALKEFETLFSFFNALFVEANPVPCKVVLQWLGLCESTVRLPLVGLSPESEAKLRRAWEALPAEYRQEARS